jgi:predicted MFS family arabinose efflux permease
VASAVAARHASLRSIVLAAAVAVAFADSSIVVLALPQLLSEFDTSITSVAWVITAYNLAVAAVALALGPRLGRVHPRVLATLGLFIFLIASVACAFAGGLGVLVALRCVQGAGAALLLTGALPALVATTRSRRRGTSVWVTAGAVGAALGPALGGALTEAFDWRAIFLAQAPVAALALPVAFGATAQPIPAEEPRSPGTRAAAANVALGLVFAALVGALFLVVVLLVDIWGLSPLEAAAVVSALPVATVAGGRLERPLAGASGAAVGALTLAVGLAGLALLPASSVALVIASLGLCGAGLGLALPFLSRSSLEGGALAAAGARSIGARHAGLVLGLVLIAPLLAAGVETGAERAALGATAAVLDAPVGIADKVSLALALDGTIAETPKGSLPDIDEAFHGREGAGVERLRARLADTLEATLTRSFRSSFGLAALFAALASVPLALLRRQGPT